MEFKQECFYTLSMDQKEVDELALAIQHVWIDNEGTSKDDEVLDSFLLTLRSHTER